jgi:hypothetical protein
VLAFEAPVYPFGSLSRSSCIAFSRKISTARSIRSG